MNRYKIQFRLMRFYKKILIVILSAILIFFIVEHSLYADILVTNDDMILNGKVVKKTRESVIFANYHGTFTIKRKNIKKLTETRSYKSDIAIFKKMGKKVSSIDIKKNYESGVKKKEDKKNEDRVEKASNKVEYVFDLHASPFLFFNFDRLSKVLPMDYGAILSFDFIFTSAMLGKSGIAFPGLKMEIDYLHSSSSSDRIDAIVFSTGPSFNIKFNVRKYNFYLNIIPIIGFGYYYIKDEDFKNWRFKIKTGAVIGMTLPYKRLIVTPAVRFIYVIDNRVPLIALGISVGLGYSFF